MSSSPATSPPRNPQCPPGLGGGKPVAVAEVAGRGDTRGQQLSSVLGHHRQHGGVVELGVGGERRGAGVEAQVNVAVDQAWHEGAVREVEPGGVGVDERLDLRRRPDSSDARPLGQYRALLDHLVGRPEHDSPGEDRCASHTAACSS
jgi:hypothetical protein